VVFITLVLAFDEWHRVRQTAEVYWPHQQLDREVSRSEVTRHWLFGGLDALRVVSARSQQEMADSHATACNLHRELTRNCRERRR